MYTNDYNEYLKSILGFPRISKEEEKELALQIQTSEDPNVIKKCREKLILSNLALVIFMAKKMHHDGKVLSLMDFIADGNLSLCKASTKYDPRKTDASFGTYAFRAISNNMIRLMSNSDFIRKPNDHYANLVEIERAKSVCGDSASERAIAKEAKMTVGLLKRVVNGSSFSFLGSPQTEEEFNIEDTEFNCCDNVRNDVDRNEVAQYILGSMQGALESQKKIIEYKLEGMDDAQIGRLTGVTRQAIGKSMSSIRKFLRKKMKEDKKDFNAPRDFFKENEEDQEFLKYAARLPKRMALKRKKQLYGLHMEYSLADTKMEK